MLPIEVHKFINYIRIACLGSNFPSRWERILEMVLTEASTTIFDKSVEINVESVEKRNVICSLISGKFTLTTSGISNKYLATNFFAHGAG